MDFTVQADCGNSPQVDMSLHSIANKPVFAPTSAGFRTNEALC